MVYKGMQSSYIWLIWSVDYCSQETNMHRPCNLATFGSYGVYLIYLKLALLVVKEQQKRAKSGVYRDK